MVFWSQEHRRHHGKWHPERIASTRVDPPAHSVYPLATSSEIGAAHSRGLPLLPISGCCRGSASLKPVSTQVEASPLGCGGLTMLRRLERALRLLLANLTRGLVAMALDDPVLIVVLPEIDERLSQLFYGLKRLQPKEVLL